MSRERWVRLVAAAALLMATSVITVTQQAGATTQAEFYVSPSGSDSNSGTLSLPFLTIEKARQAVDAINGSMTGDIIVYLRGGDYNLTSALQLGSGDGGTNGYRVIYKNYSSETPKLLGNIRTFPTGWANDLPSTAIKKVSTAGAVLNTRQLWVDDVRAERARGGYGTAAIPPKPGGAVTFSNCSSSPACTYKNVDPLAINWKNPTEIELVYTGNFTKSTTNAPWTESRCQVASIDTDGPLAAKIAMKQDCIRWVTKAVGSYASTFPFYVENWGDKLDAAGEFYVDHNNTSTHSDDNLRYYPRAGETFNNGAGQALVVAPQIETLIDINGSPSSHVVNITFDGLTLSHTSWLGPNSNDGYAEEQAGQRYSSAFPYDDSTNAIKGGLKIPGALNIHGGENILVTRSVLNHLGGAGVVVDDGSQDVTIEGNKLLDLSGSAVQIGDIRYPDPADPLNVTDGTTVKNNYIKGIGKDYHGSAAIFTAYVTGTEIAHNDISDFPWSGISTGWGWGNSGTQPSVAWTVGGNKIVANRLSDGLNYLADGGGIYNLGWERDQLIQGNVISDMKGTPGGIYLDQASRDSRLVNNVVWNNDFASRSDGRSGQVIGQVMQQTFIHDWVDGIRILSNFADFNQTFYFPNTTDSTRFSKAAPVSVGDCYVHVATEACSAPETLLPASIIADAGLESAWDFLNPPPGGSDTTAPSTPGSAASNFVTSGTVEMHWTASTDGVGVTGYEVDQTSPIALVVAVTTGTTASVSGLAPSTTYQFVIRARDAAGNLSSASSTVSVTTGSW